MPDADAKQQPALNRVQNAHGQTFVGGIERGMIFWGEIREDESRDSEHYHHPKPCPWIVLSPNDVHRKLPIVLAAPLTHQLHKDQKANFRHFRIRIPEAHFEKYELPDGVPGLDGDSLVLTEQLRVFAHDRLVGNPIAKASLQALASIEAGLKYVLDIA